MTAFFSTIGEDKLFRDMEESIQNNLPDLYEVIVLHSGGELYHQRFQSYGYPEYLVNFKSVSKLLFALAVGCMLDDGILASPWERVSTLLPEYALVMPAPMREKLCLHHLLSMSSGYQWQESGQIFFQWMHSKDWVRFALERENIWAPGENFCYDTSGIHLVSAIIRQKTGKPALSYILQRLMNPMGVQSVMGQKSPEGNDFGGSELYMSPQDIAQIGRLLLNNGEWEGRRLLSPAWIAACFTEHIRIDKKYGYGYGCFVTDLTLPYCSEKKFHVWVVPGTGGQYLYYCPDYHSVVVIASLITPRDGRNPLHLPASQLMPRFIFPALVRRQRI